MVAVLPDQPDLDLTALRSACREHFVPGRPALLADYSPGDKLAGLTASDLVAGHKMSSATARLAGMLRRDNRRAVAGSGLAVACLGIDGQLR